MMKLVLLKYAVLLSALCVCVYVLLVRNSYTWTMFYTLLGLALLYTVLSVTANLQQVKRTDKPAQRFVYYTPGMLTKKLILAGGFAIAAGILLFSGIKVALFGFLLLALLLSEIASLWIHIRNDLYYVYFDNKMLVFQQDLVKKIFASHIHEIEYRYDIFYLTLTNKQVQLLETPNIEAGKRAEFVRTFIDWAKQNDVNFTEEASEKLKL